MTYTTIQDAAAALFAAFVSAKRDNGDTFYKLADGSPEWMTDAVHAAHGDMMPDDWRYACIRGLCSSIADSSDPEDERGEIVDGEVDVYNAALVAWLGSNLWRGAYCDDAMQELGAPSSVWDLLRQGQYQEADETFGLLVAALEGEVSE
jgi:hypothetical protein